MSTPRLNAKEINVSKITEDHNYAESLYLKINPKSSFFYQSPEKKKLQNQRPTSSSDSSISMSTTSISSNSSSETCYTSENSNDEQQHNVLNNKSKAEADLLCYDFKNDQDYNQDTNTLINISSNSEKEIESSSQQENESSSKSEGINKNFVAPRPQSKPEQYVIYKSMNYLPFTTRFEMLKKGTGLRLVDANPRQAVKILDNKPPEYSEKKRRILKYVSVSSDSNDSTSSSDDSTYSTPDTSPRHSPVTSPHINMSHKFSSANLQHDTINKVKNSSSIVENMFIEKDENNNILSNPNSSDFASKELLQSSQSGKVYKLIISRNGSKFEFKTEVSKNIVLSGNGMSTETTEDIKLKSNEDLQDHHSNLNGKVHSSSEQVSHKTVSEFQASDAAETLIAMANSQSQYTPLQNYKPIATKRKSSDCETTKSKDNVNIKKPLVKCILPNPLSKSNINKSFQYMNSNGQKVCFIKPYTQDLENANIKVRMQPIKIKIGDNISFPPKSDEKLSTTGESSFISVLKPGKDIRMKMKNQDFLNQNKATTSYGRNSPSSVSETRNDQNSGQNLDLEQFATTWHSLSTDTAGNPIHKCLLCSKVYTIYDAFKSHIQTHLKQQNKCTVCGKTFSRSWLLKGHMRTHTGERPYRCPETGCNKAFADRSNLRSHMMIHTTEGKTHVCPVCDRAFAQKRYLHKHMAEVCKGSSFVEGEICSGGSPSSSSTSSPTKYRKVLPKCPVESSNKGNGS